MHTTITIDMSVLTQFVAQEGRESSVSTDFPPRLYSEVHGRRPGTARRQRTAPEATPRPATGCSVAESPLQAALHLGSGPWQASLLSKAPRRRTGGHRTPSTYARKRSPDHQATRLRSSQTARENKDRDRSNYAGPDSSRAEKSYKGPRRTRQGEKAASLCRQTSAHGGQRLLPGGTVRPDRRLPLHGNIGRSTVSPRETSPGTDDRQFYGPFHKMVDSASPQTARHAHQEPRSWATTPRTGHIKATHPALARWSRSKETKAKG